MRFYVGMALLLSLVALSTLASTVRAVTVANADRREIPATITPAHCHTAAFKGMLPQPRRTKKMLQVA